MLLIYICGGGQRIASNPPLLQSFGRYTQLSDPERAMTKGVKKDIE
jgi:hypothetical protein